MNTSNIIACSLPRSMVMVLSLTTTVLLTACFESSTEQAPPSLITGSPGGNNPPPQTPDLSAADDTLSVPIGIPGVVSVVSNDTSKHGELIVESYDQTSAQGGAITYNGDGTFTYTPPANFEGEDSFTYTVKDSAGNTATAKVVISVSAQVIPNGQTFYANNCAICHAAGNDDTTFAFNASDLVIGSNSLTTNLTEFGGEYQLMGAFYDISQPDIDALKAYLNSLKI